MSKEKPITLAEHLKQAKKNQQDFQKRIEKANKDHLDRVNEMKEDMDGQKKKDN